LKKKWRGPEENSDFCENCNNSEYCEIWDKLQNSSFRWKPLKEGVERAPTRTAIFAKTTNIASSAKFAKNSKFGRVSETCKGRGCEGPDKNFDFCENCEHGKISEKL